MNFKEAREFVRGLNLKNSKQWEVYRESKEFPSFLPKHPDQRYRNSGWLSMKDWLGIIPGFIHNHYRDFNSAKQFIQSLGLKSQKEFLEYCRIGNKPWDIPQNPRKIYKNEWISMSDWLGYENPNDFTKTKHVSFEEAKLYLKPLKLKSGKEWREFSKSKRPSNIPSNPQRKYKSKWKGWADFLGKED